VVRGGRTAIAVAVGGWVLCGFVVLAVMWFAGDHPDSLPGLWDYPSAYLGDGILLPIAAGLLTVGIARLPKAGNERWIGLGAALVAAAGAAFAQWLWLRDDHPGLNWTLPRPHHFNAAGWWHAGYFVAVAATFAILLGVLLRRLGAARREPATVGLLGGAGTTAVLSGLLGYAALAVDDSTSATLAARTSLVALGLTAVVIIGLAAVALRRTTAALRRPLLMAVVFAAGVVIARHAPWSDQRTLVLGAAGAALLGIGVGLLALVPGIDMRDEYRPDPAAAAVAAVTASVGLCGTWTWAAEEVAHRRWVGAAAWLVGHLAMIVVVPLGAIAGAYQRWLRQAIDVMLVLGAISAIGLAAVLVGWWKETGADFVELTSLGLALAVASILFPVLRMRFVMEADEEERGADPDGSYTLPRTLRISASAALGMLIVVGIAGGFMLLAYTLAAAADRRYLPDAGAHPYAVPLIALGLALVAAATPLRMLHSRRRGQLRPVRIAAAVLVPLWPAALLVAGVYDLPPVNVVGLAGGLLLGLWSFDSVWCNTILFQGSRSDRLGWAVAGGLGVSGFVSGYFALTAALSTGVGTVYTWFNGIATATAVIAVHGLLGAVGGTLAVPPTTTRTRHGVGHNLLQDNALITLLYTMALVITAHTLLHVPPEVGFPARLAATILVCGPFLAYFLIPYQWLLGLNVGHLDREIKTRAADPTRVRAVIAREGRLLDRVRFLVRAGRHPTADASQHRFVRVLAAHIANQNAIGRAVVFLSVVGLLVLVSANAGAVFGFFRRYGRDQPRPARAVIAEPGSPG